MNTTLHNWCHLAQLPLKFTANIMIMQSPHPHVRTIKNIWTHTVKTFSPQPKQCYTCTVNTKKMTSTRKMELLQARGQYCAKITNKDTVGLVIDLCGQTLPGRYPDPLVLHQKWIHHPPFNQDLVSKTNYAMFHEHFRTICGPLWRCVTHIMYFCVRGTNACGAAVLVCIVGDAV